MSSSTPLSLSSSEYSSKLGSAEMTSRRWVGEGRWGTIGEREYEEEGELDAELELEYEKLLPPEEEEKEEG